MDVIRVEGLFSFLIYSFLFSFIFYIILHYSYQLMIFGTDLSKIWIHENGLEYWKNSDFDNPITDKINLIAVRSNKMEQLVQGIPLSLFDILLFCSN